MKDAVLHEQDAASTTKDHAPCDKLSPDNIQVPARMPSGIGWDTAQQMAWGVTDHGGKEKTDVRWHSGDDEEKLTVMSMRNSLAQGRLTSYDLNASIEQSAKR